MEGINGLEATRVIRDRFPKVRVVLMSAYDDREYRRLATEAGAIAFISKAEFSAEALALALAGC